MARATIKGAVLTYLNERNPEIVDEEVMRRIRRYVAATVQRDRAPSEAYLLDILLSTEVAIDRRLGGLPIDLRGRVDLGGLEQARRSLIDMSREYSRAKDPARREDVRRAVRRAKNRLKLRLGRSVAAEKQSEKRRDKHEILEWLIVWLENPLVFESWVEVRSATASKSYDQSVSDT